MKRLILCLPAALALSLPARTEPLGPLQDQAGAPTDPFQAEGATDTAALVAHYAAVEAELLAAPTAGLDPAAAARRAALIGYLREYRERADLGQDLLELGGRPPYFVDPQGRRCAVAWLLHRSGEDALVDSIAAEHNHAWLVELADDPRLQVWLEHNGLTASEAARIQGPVTVPRPGIGVAPGVVTGGSVSGPSTGGNNPSGATTGTTSGADVGDWWMWWEMNKLDYLRPDRVERTISAVDLERYGRPGEAERATLTKALTVLAADDLKHARSEVRAAAALVVGRVEPERAGELLEPLLHDSNSQVRHCAVLGLGLSGRSEHVPYLRALLVGRDERGRVAEVSPYGAYYAGIALGLAREHMPAEVLDTIVAHAARGVEGGRGHDPQTLGVLAYQRLTDSPQLVPFTRAVLNDENAGLLLRCQAAEALDRANDAGIIAELLDAASKGPIELRRSALLALGSAQNPLAADAIATAFELEAELTTRGYALLALGGCGREEHSEFIERQLLKGSSNLRPYAALALGIHARRFNDPGDRATLRAALSQRQSSVTEGALVVASGIARDELALQASGHRLQDAQGNIDRYHAALSLGLICKPVTGGVLREAFTSEDSDLPRAGIALGLGMIGDAPDAGLLARAIETSAAPELRQQFTVALALHDSVEALGEAVGLLGRDDVAAGTRAALLGAAGILVDGRDGLALGEIVRGSNPDVQPDWMRELWQVSI
ncbi:HEAT repeat domain-containing protein [Engelhardtia mirabilis]|uniref:HEAT repeat protein n=1 Tax=Engelhardtia mirabilis TaxID=2528011 RepID=A0A518BIR6_9BACT|nr:hypothetical protein Pla133_19470 [Planctomycetes bacterium Pla133]QDV01197.1 hypothetical protein Pla86_19460 [Planctomycetes bacterium Pla86]